MKDERGPITSSPPESASRSVFLASESAPSQSDRWVLILPRVSPLPLLLAAADLALVFAAYWASLYLRPRGTWGTFYSVGDPFSDLRQLPHPYLFLALTQLACLALVGLYRPSTRLSLPRIFTGTPIAVLLQTTLVISLHRLMVGQENIRESIYYLFVPLNTVGIVTLRLLTYSLTTPRIGVPQSLGTLWSWLGAVPRWAGEVVQALRHPEAVLALEAPPTVYVPETLPRLENLRKQLILVREGRQALAAQTRAVNSQAVARLRAEYISHEKSLRRELAQTMLQARRELRVLRRDRGALARYLTALKGAGAVLELRRAVGELNQTDYEAKKEQRNKGIKAYQSQIQEVGAAIGRYQEILQDRTLPRSPLLLWWLESIADFLSEALAPAWVGRYLRSNPAAGFIIGFMALLMVCAFLLILRLEPPTEIVPNVAYLLLVVGVGIRLWEMIRGRGQEEEENEEVSREGE